MVLVRVKAAGVNPVDWKVREGFFKERVPLQFPATLGMIFRYPRKGRRRRW
jgi:NADPH:quinone reductase-like Zn-dependent oxidoreductase